MTRSAINHPSGLYSVPNVLATSCWVARVGSTAIRTVDVTLKVQQPANLSGWRNTDGYGPAPPLRCAWTHWQYITVVLWEVQLDSGTTPSSPGTTKQPLHTEIDSTQFSPQMSWSRLTAPGPRAVLLLCGTPQLIRVTASPRWDGTTVPRRPQVV